MTKEFTGECQGCTAKLTETDRAAGRCTRCAVPLFTVQQKSVHDTWNQVHDDDGRALCLDSSRAGEAYVEKQCEAFDFRVVQFDASHSCMLCNDDEMGCPLCGVERYRVLDALVKSVITFQRINMMVHFAVPADIEIALRHVYSTLSGDSILDVNKLTTDELLEAANELVNNR